MKREFVDTGLLGMNPAKLQRIMLVEDEPDIRAVCELALDTDEELNVRSYPDADSAYRAVDEFQPDLILLDVMMPGEDGPTMMMRLRDAGKLEETNVVFLTAKAQPDEVRRYLEMGAIGVIEKPFDPMNLASRIRKIWSQRYG